MSDAFVTVTEDDVPGAKLKNTVVEANTCVVLKRWLKCRKLPFTGRKQDLVCRVHDCIAAGNASRIDPSIDGGKRLQKKREDAGIIDGSDVLYTPHLDWGPFPSVNIPTLFNRGHIYHYLFESVNGEAGGESDRELSDDDFDESARSDYGTEKPVRKARGLLKGGYVFNLNDTTYGNVYYLKCKVKASMRPANYTVTCHLHLRSGAIKECSCECYGSALGRCSHVVAVLLLVANHVDKHGYEATSCTSLPRTWGQGAPEKEPMPVTARDYTEKQLVQKRATFDPRPTSVKATSNSTEAVDTVNNFLTTLQLANRDNGHTSLWEHMWTIHYENYEPDWDYIISMCELYYEFLHTESSMYIANCPQAASGDYMPIAREVPDSSGQSESGVWKRERALLFTLSGAHIIMHLTDNGKASFLREHLWQMTDDKKNRALQWGKENEPKARAQYTTLKKGALNDPDVFVEEVGLFVSLQHPELGCSPDGLVHSANSYVRLLEIKCQFSLRKVHPNDFDSPNALTPQQKRHFCLERTDGRLSLKQDHSYYYQVQMSMGVLGIRECDLAVWTPEGMVILDTEFDQQLWNAIRDSLILRHRMLLIPEYFECRIPRNLPPVEVLY